jgi:hypothetical protein
LDLLDPPAGSGLSLCLDPSVSGPHGPGTETVGLSAISRLRSTRLGPEGPAEALWRTLSRDSDGPHLDPIWSPFGAHLGPGLGLGLGPSVSGPHSPGTETMGLSAISGPWGPDSSSGTSLGGPLGDPIRDPWTRSPGGRNPGFRGFGENMYPKPWKWHFWTPAYPVFRGVLKSSGDQFMGWCVSSEGHLSGGVKKGCVPTFWRGPEGVRRAVIGLLRKLSPGPLKTP